MNQTEVDWLFLYPQGMKKIVMYMKDRFNNTPMVITENGKKKRNFTFLSFKSEIQFNLSTNNLNKCIWICWDASTDTTGNIAGIAENDNLNPSIIDTLNDFHRVNYMRSYLNSLANAITDGADVRGYFVWSLLDNFEWLDGYKLRFGLHYVNYTNLQRTPKLSATMYKQLMYNFNIQLEKNTAQNQQEKMMESKYYFDSSGTVII